MNAPTIAWVHIMKRRNIAAALAFSIFSFAGAAVAGEYQCTVYCVGPSGSTSVTIRAGSASEAASIVDRQGHAICKAAGHQAATSQTMSSSQCR
ncbi:putative membrane protein [Azospirillum agricola]|uniref:hypothetical protein n=1 Tax=Azospirillum agricola TaxID=1720247 RepID=UPI001AE32D32|nr:hypothetical protein [Azospirillum agricola]MBP2229067.1 putative membrane protein [Azospirillum agricola]